MRIIKFAVAGNKLVALNDREITQHTVDFIVAEFRLDKLWAGLNVAAIFYNDPQNPYHVFLDENNRAKVPAEVMTDAGAFNLSLVGTKGTTVAPTNPVTITVTGTLVEGVTPPDPTPSIYQQILDRIDEIEAGESGITKTYVDAQDAATLASANNYADSGLNTKAASNHNHDGEYQPKGAYLTSETDPTVASWAKQASKPTYDAAEVGAEALGAVNTHNASVTAHNDLRTAQAQDFKDVSYNPATGELTLTRNNSTTVKVTIPLAHAVVSGSYDETSKEIVLLMSDDSEIRIPASALIDVYTGEENAELQVTVSAQNVIEAHLKTASITKEHLATNLADEIEAKADNSSLAQVATSGSYNDLEDKPTIPTKVGDITNDVGYISEETDPLFTAWDKDYNDLTNKPTIPTAWSGTQAQWDALNSSEKATYDIAMVV